jgi:thiol-disulfide isomerase/thioredoxin
MRRAAAALAATVAALAAASVHALEAGSPVPAITAPRLASSGAPVSLSALKGQVVYVDFWASWCVPCRLSMPALDAMYRKYSPKGFAVVGFNKDVSNADAERFLQRVPVSFTLAQDGKDAAAQAFDVKAMPSGYLVDRKGVVRKVHRGFTAETAAELEHEIEELLKEPA